ncbi:hypothetical protein B27N_03249 [Alcanivorax marinus]|nr:hypothetical protein [Alloalcanivorax marinus]
MDARGLNCPLPLLKTRQALRGLAPGALLEVAATDAGSARDIPEYLRQSPHELVRRQDDDREYRFLIRRGEEGQGPERGR